MEHISYPSINQFRQAVKHIKDNAFYHNKPVPLVKFRGTVKIHGTNAAVATNGTEVWCQSRERIITPQDDNAGFAMWHHGKREVFNQMFDVIRKTYAIKDIQIFGEWAGGSIQKGVGMNKLPKLFIVFGIHLGDHETGQWVHHSMFERLILTNGTDIFYSGQFKTWEIVVDANKPEDAQNQLVEITNQIEACCPVARSLLGETDEPLIGEGAVWEAVEVIDSTLNFPALRFKTKGEKHSVSKVKTVASVDTEKVNSIREFVENTLTENRLNQGMDKLREMGLDVSVENTGTFIRWCVTDILKEELDTLSDSGFTAKDVTGQIATAARQFFLQKL